MGCDQTEQPVVSEEAIGPAMVVLSSTPTAQAEPFAERLRSRIRSQPSRRSNTRRKLECWKYPNQPRGDWFTSVTMHCSDVLGPTRFLTQPVFSSAGSSSVASVSCRGIRNPETRSSPTANRRFAFSSGCNVKPLSLTQVRTAAKALRCFVGPTQDHEIVGIPHHLEARVRHQVVQRVEIDVADERTQHGPLRRTQLRRPRRGFSTIPAFTNASINDSTEPSAIFSCRRSINRSCGIESKYPFRSASTTWT